MDTSDLTIHNLENVILTTDGLEKYNDGEYIWVQTVTKNGIKAVDIIPRELNKNSKSQKHIISDSDNNLYYLDYEKSKLNYKLPSEFINIIQESKTEIIDVIQMNKYDECKKIIDRHHSQYN